MKQETAKLQREEECVGENSRGQGIVSTHTNLLAELSWISRSCLVRLMS